MARTPFSLTGGLRLRTARTDDDIERLARFNKSIHQGEDLESLVRTLIREHPYGEGRFWLFLEEAKTKRIVSSLALIPWRVMFDGKEVRAAELGFVGTRPAFRKRGLSRFLIERFHELAEAEGFAWSFLQGIPFYYRRFGYEYAVPLENHIMLPLSRIPPLLRARPRAQAGRLDIRRAVPADRDRLKELYERSMRAFPIHTARSPEVWDFLLGASLKTEMIHDTFCLAGRQGEVNAYFRVAHHGFGDGLILDEASDLEPAEAAAVLGFLKTLARERRKPRLRLNLHRKHALAQWALLHGATDEWRYAWQIRIGNPGRFLKAIAPVLARRAERGKVRELSIDLYESAWRLAFERGRPVAVSRLKRAPESACCLPPFAACQLFFGHRSLSELSGIYPDVRVGDKERPLGEALFPVRDSYLHTNY